MALVQCRECGSRVSDSAGTCPHCGVSGPAGLSLLLVGRKAQLGGAMLSLNLFVDGVPQGNMRPGNVGRFELAPGQHVLEADVPGRGSYTATVTIAPGQTVRAEMSISGFNGAPKITLG
jgi:hypothetical protein